MLPELHAERQLAAIEAGAVPHMTRQVSREVLDKYRDMLGSRSRPRRATHADLAAIGIQVETVPREEVNASD